MRKQGNEEAWKFVPQREADSVFLAGFPAPEPGLVSDSLEEEFRVLQGLREVVNLALEQKRLLQRERQEERRREAAIGQILGLAERVLELVDRSEPHRWSLACGAAAARSRLIDNRSISRLRERVRLDAGSRHGPASDERTGGG